MDLKHFRRFVLVIVFGLMASQVFSGEPGKPLKSIAVLEFEAKGVSTLEASTLTDRFRSELVQTKVFKQIERNQIEQIFNEQKLQMSGTVSDDKLVEIGELLGAELLVIGSIGKLGSTYTIDLRLVDVQSGEIIASYFKDLRGEVDGLLGLFRVIASEIAGKEYTAPTAVQAPTTQISSNIVTTPVFGSSAAAELQARQDAADDYSKLIWGASGVVGGTGGSCVFPVVGGLLGTGTVAAAGYIVDASPPQSRLDQIANEDTATRQAYLKTYEKELKKNRAKWGGGGGMLGCCVTTLLIGMALSSTTY